MEGWGSGWELSTDPFDKLRAGFGNRLSGWTREELALLRAGWHNAAIIISPTVSTTNYERTHASEITN